MYERVWTVRFSDTDPFGIAHYPRIVDAIHETADMFMESIDHPFWNLEDEEGAELGLPLIELDVVFEGQVEAGDQVVIQLTTDVGESSVRFDYEAHVGDTVAFTGFEQRACVPVGAKSAIALPSDLRKALEAAGAESSS